MEKYLCNKKYVFFNVWVFILVVTEQVGLDGETVAPSRRLEELIHLAELCVDLLQQNEDHYAEVKGCIFITFFSIYLSAF